MAFQRACNASSGRGLSAKRTPRLLNDLARSGVNACSIGTVTRLYASLRWGLRKRARLLGRRDTTGVG